MVFIINHIMNIHTNNSLLRRDVERSAPALPCGILTAWNLSVYCVFV